ncbi:hypothetical protein HPP92_004044 [Vanilla planifolia]|uniref:Thioredoxin domain-containing protein n=1 Tax=Vanilla planifolia TaxID=51239 RepID=A0A835S8P5_VANPL|nr:hypothetical protein HPP92_004044 [Vanilla planifolia]
MFPSGEVQNAQVEMESMPNRMRSALSPESKKPTSKDCLCFTSPASPPRARPSVSTGTNATSGSSTSSGSTTGKAGIAGRRTLSGEHMKESTKPGHRRSGSEPVISFGGTPDSGAKGPNSPVSSPASNVLPAGNICPSGKISRSGMTPIRSASRSDVLGTGAKNYGHGSIIRGGGGEAGAGNGSEHATRKATMSTDPDEVRRAGNDFYRRGQFVEALKLYDRAIAICPENAVCRSNRAAALTGLGRLAEAVKECEEAIRLDPSFLRAHQRLASLHIRLGQVESAGRHLFWQGQQPDPVELQKLQALEKHTQSCFDARKNGDWKIVLRESNAAIHSGADSSSQLISAKAEALLCLHQLEEADSTILKALNLEIPRSQSSYFAPLSNSYIHKVHAQIELALGRFDSAVASAEKARQIDPGNFEATVTLNKVRSVARARCQGNEFFNMGRFEEACLAYGEGLKYDPSNPVLYCNRAACMSKLGYWDKSIEDCNEALRFYPNYTKALLRRAASNGKLEHWAEAVRDYEVLRKELPRDTEVEEALLHARAALRTSRGVEVISGLEHFRTAISLHGVFVVHFMLELNQHCIQISPFLDMLCTKFPFVNFLKVDIDKNPAVCKVENVTTVPTVKIYKNGVRVKEMICPSQQVLESSVRLYSLAFGSAMMEAAAS